MKSKKLMIMVTIVILLSILNVAFYSYIRISNIKDINKEEKEDQDMKGADLTQGGVEDLKQQPEPVNYKLNLHELEN